MSQMVLKNLIKENKMKTFKNIINKTHPDLVKNWGDSAELLSFNQILELMKEASKAKLTKNIDNSLIEELEQEQKICLISNDPGTFRMQVDHKIVGFTGIDCADYFVELYERMGYKVICENNTGQEGFWPEYKKDYLHKPKK